MIRNASQYQEEDELLLADQEALGAKLLLYNDDVNTFDHVIDCLMEICQHELHQAEQCALLVHYKGKATVKEGEFDSLRIMCEGLCDRGLSAVVEI